MTSSCCWTSSYKLVLEKIVFQVLQENSVNIMLYFVENDCTGLKLDTSVTHVWGSFQMNIEKSLKK